jgi:predicted DsbA family dithiol-disulfide isomerase
LIEEKLEELAKLYDSKIYFRFVPFVSLRAIRDTLHKRGKRRFSIEQLNLLFETSYSATLDAKAAQLQGRRKGREFIKSLQNEVAIKNNEYSNEIATEIAKKIKLNMDDFLTDRQTDTMKRSFVSTQQMAVDMGIQTYPSAVVFDYGSDEDGLLFENDILENIMNFQKRNFNKGSHDLPKNSWQHEGPNLKKLIYL